MDVVRPPYMPVLKWKQGEQLAMTALDTATRSSIVPLIELRSYKTPFTAQQCLAPLSTCWNRLALFDCADPKGMLSTWRLATFDGVVAAVVGNAAALVPVVNLDDPAFADAKRIRQLSSCRQGIALRIRVANIRSLTAGDLLARASFAQTKWLVRNVVIDLCTTPSLAPQEITFLIKEITSLTAQGYEVHLVSGAYPDGYKGLVTGINIVPRSDWRLWASLRSNHGLPKTVGYGDYTVVAPTWLDRSGGGGVPTAYRYADTNDWLIYKGTSSAGSESFSISTLLVTHPAFRGAACCSTDRVIIQRAAAGQATKAVRPGGATQHIAEGITHHITLVTKEQYP